ncbi:MAG TPA: phenylacetate--CoA ligase family protein [Salinimicrobium sp.]|nr:phenylacetate--CoA ligase family protein [Salinimicrobium sp.]
MNLFTLSLQLNNYPIKEAKNLLKEIQSIPAEDFQQYQERKKQEIVEFHLQHNAFYRGFFKTEKFSKWEDVPVIRKQDMQRPLQDRLSVGYSAKKVLVAKTSGSGGHPFIFSKDKFCHALTWAIFSDRYGLHGIDLNNSLQARFYGIPLNKTGYFKERLKDKLSRRYRFPIFNLNVEELERVLLKFKKTNFEYINGYTSSIVLFAKFLKEKNIVLKSVCPTLKLCIVTSEMLFENDRIILEEQLGVKVLNEYGASEVGLIAFQNLKNELVISSEDLFVEILDDNNKAVPNGAEGKIVITSLFNKSHPFIRYEIGDRGILHESSTAKKQILQQLTGRTNDIAILPSGKVVPGLTFYYVTKSVIEDAGRVKEFVVQQKASDTFKFIYVGQMLSAEKINDIKKAVEVYLEKGLKLEFENVEVLNRSNRGKLKQFEKLF